MRGYDRDEYGQSVEEYDDYEDEGEGYEEEEDGEEYEEEVEEEDPKPTKEALEYLELRQRLKEQFRKQMKKEGGSSLANSSDKKKKLPYDNYGSFFGPSQPIISERVIQESKSLLETQHLASRVSSSLHSNKKSSGSTSAGSKPVAYNQKPRVINEAKNKVQKLKDTRDYSFLLSDDVELPASANDRPPRSVSVPNSEVRSSQMALKSKLPMENNGRHAHGGRDERKPASMNGHSNGGRDERRPVSMNGHAHGGRDERRPVSMNGQMHSKGGPNKLSSASRRPDSTSVDSRKQLGSNNGNGPSRPLGPKGSKMPASTAERKASAPGVKNSLPGVRKPLPSKLQSSIPKQHLQQRKEVREPNEPKVLPRQSAGLTKPQINKPQMQRQISSRPISQEHRPKRKPLRRHPDDEYDDEVDYRSMIRNMFKYNPDKFAGDDDCSDMEANFEDIMREEKRSARIARQEDEEQARLIEEEERREQMAKRNRLLKKRKLGHH
ncbi:unnamed protein product [Prunus armeniaca]